jgi:hypothetical protein
MKYARLFLLLTLWFCFACKTNERAQYFISSDPAGALISVDGVDYGTSPDTISVRFLKEEKGNSTAVAKEQKTKVFYLISVSPVAGMKGRLKEVTDTLCLKKYPSGSVIFFDLKEEPLIKISPVQIKPMQRKESPATQRKDDRTITE